MGDYVPIHNPGHEITLTASAAITGGQLVMSSGNDTVAPATAAGGSKYLGVAAHDAANGAKVTVLTGVGQVHESTAAGAVTAGDLLIIGAVTGTVATVGAGTFDKVVGVAITGAADTGLCKWKATR